jgi:hypothetical protein
MDVEMVEIGSVFTKLVFGIFPKLFSFSSRLYSSQATIFDLPSEVLVRIFSRLSLKNLKVLTEVCKSFNETIGSSASLMKSFKVKWKKETHENQDINLLVDSRRRYQKLNICGIKGMNSHLSIFIKAHSSSLVCIRIRYGSLRMSELIAILETTANNIKILKISPEHLQNDVRHVKAITFPKLATLVITVLTYSHPWDMLNELFQRARNIEVSFPFIYFPYNLFLTSSSSFMTLQALNFSYRTLGEGERVSHCQFLQNQTKLRKLKLLFEEVANETRLFNDSLCSAAPFKLEKLIVFAKDENLPHSYQEDLFNFIKQQHASLRELHIRHTILTAEKQEFLLKMQLHHLYLSCCTFVSDDNRQINVQNKTIKSISLFRANNGGIVLAEFLMRCRQVGEIYLNNGDISVPLSIALNRLSKLKKLTLVNSLSVPICIPSLKILHLRNIHEEENTRQNVIALVGNSRQLKELRASRRLINDPEFAWALEQLNLEKLKFID